MIGYIYTSEVEVEYAVEQINMYFGIPSSLASVTITYTNYLIWGDKWVILHDESLEVILGGPVVLPDLPNSDIYNINDLSIQ